MENLKPEQYAVLALAQIVTEENLNPKYDNLKSKLETILKEEGYDAKKIANEIQGLSLAFRAYDALDDFILDFGESMNEKAYANIVDSMDEIWGFLSKDEIDCMKKKYNS